MRKLLFYVAAALCMTACQNDDTDMSDYTTPKAIYIDYNGTTATVTGDTQGIVSVSGAHVTVNSQTADSLLLVLSGSTSNGSLLVFRNEARRYAIMLNNVKITNPSGPAINNQCGKALYVKIPAGTSNSLADGAEYTERTYQQKGTLFSEGQIYFSGSGKLSINANCKNAIASDDYVCIADNVVINTATASTGSNGIKVNDGLYIQGGTVTIDVLSDAGRGIKCDSAIYITGGNTTISTSGDCVFDTEENDFSSAACIKCDYDFNMTGGTLTLQSSGDGGKGINCSGNVNICGGSFAAVTTGSNINAKPKAVKGSGITVSGGSFYAKVNKSWACDNGTDSDIPADRITVSGTPATSSIEKKLVNIVF